MRSNQVNESQNSYEIAKKIVGELRSVGYVAYFAGGWVRDWLLGISSNDIDIATDAQPQDIIKLFPEHVLIGAHFGVVIVLVDGHEFEVATFRKDILYTNGRKPESVSLKSTPEEDAIRRDFTINGMFFDPFKELVLDFVGGKEALQQKIICTIGNPHERFQEDKLRMIRAVRFAFRFGFHIEKTTKEAIHLSASTLFPSVSMERIWQELCKMRLGTNFTEALVEMHALGLLQVIFPPLQEVSTDEIRHRLKDTKQLSFDVPTMLFLVQLFSQADSTFLKNLHTYLKASNEDGKWITTFFDLKQIIDLEKANTVTLWDWAKFYARPQAKICLEVLAKTVQNQDLFLEEHQKKQQLLACHIERIIKKDPLIKSKDLVLLGIQPGIELGFLLKEAEKIAVNLHIVSKETLLQQIQINPTTSKYFNKKL